MGSRMTGHTIKIRNQDQLQGRSGEREKCPVLEKLRHLVINLDCEVLA
jgi:hypothetical protein